MQFHWIDGFEIAVKVEDGAVVISANKEGLLSLANHLRTLVEQDSGHFHLDEHNALEEESMELIVVKQ